MLPPFVETGVKLTALPAQKLLLLALILKVGVTAVPPIVIVIMLEVLVVKLAQDKLEVITHLTLS